MRLIKTPRLIQHKNDRSTWMNIDHITCISEPFNSDDMGDHWIINISIMGNEHQSLYFQDKDTANEWYKSVMRYAKKLK